MEHLGLVQVDASEYVELAKQMKRKLQGFRDGEPEERIQWAQQRYAKSWLTRLFPAWRGQLSREDVLDRWNHMDATSLYAGSPAWWVCGYYAREDSLCDEVLRLGAAAMHGIQHIWLSPAHIWAVRGSNFGVED